MAKEYWADTYHIQLETKQLSREGWSIEYRGKKLARVNKTLLYQFLTQDSAWRKWSSLCNINIHDLIDLDWKASEKAFTSLKSWQKRRVTKFISRQSAVGKNMKRRGEWTNRKCPRCNHEVETTFHVLQCRDQGAKRQ